VLDSSTCTLNDHHWVFLAPVTDLAFNLEVREKATGRTWTHRNAAGTSATVRADTAAFACSSP